MTTVDGAASATWTLHYEVTKTSTTTLSGKEGPYNTQEEANAAAEAAKNNAIAQLQNEAQAMVDAAIAEAKAQLATITIDYKETTVPHGFDPTDSSSGSVSVPSNGSATAVVENQPWQAHVTWEKRDALTGGRITEDAEYVFYEWNVDANEYEISSNYRVTRLENGLYTVTVTNPVYTDWTEGYVYYTQDNLGKFRIEEVAAPAGYTDAALQGTDWVEHWSQEFEITASDQTYSYTGNDADYNRPQGNKVIIKKIEAHTGEIIVDDAVFTLYQWNEERGLYEKSKDYAYEEEFQTKLARLNELNILLDQEKQELVQNEKENRMQKENVNLHAEENEDWEASTVEPAAKLPAGWKWTMYSDGSGRLEGPDKQSLYSYDRMTYASAGEIEYRKSNNSSWDVFPEGSLDRFREWAEQQLLQELKKEPLQYQEFLEHQSHQDDEIEKNPLDMEDAARQAGLTVQRDQDKPGAAYFDADQNVIHVSDAGSEEDVRLSELKGYADAVIQRTATVEQPVRDLESASLAVMLAARYDVGVSDRLSQQLASAHAEAVKCPAFDLPVTLQRLDKALDYCDHFLAHEQERALEQEAENEPEPEQVTELSPQSQAFMMDL